MIDDCTGRTRDEQEDWADSQDFYILCALVRHLVRGGCSQVLWSTGCWPVGVSHCHRRPRTAARQPGRQPSAVQCTSIVITYRLPGRPFRSRMHPWRCRTMHTWHCMQWNCWHVAHLMTMPSGAVSAPTKVVRSSTVPPACRKRSRSRCMRYLQSSSDAWSKQPAVLASTSASAIVACSKWESVCIQYCTAHHTRLCR